VILELGIALGTGRGLKSLIILKQENAVMPSDLGGVVTLNFEKSPSEIFEQLEQRLLALGVDLSPVE
jgi:predicted nucleotide-binding protein